MAVPIAVCVLVFRVLGTLGVAWVPPPCSFVVCRQLASAQVLASPCGSASDGDQVALAAGLCPAVGNVQVGGSLARAAVPRVNGRLPPVVVASGLPGESEVISPISELCGDCHKCLDQSRGHLITIGLERFEARIRSEAQLVELYEIVAALLGTWCRRGLGIPMYPFRMVRIPSFVRQGVPGLGCPLRPGVLAANSRSCGPPVRGWLVFGGGGACGFRTPFDVWKMRVSRRPSWATWVRRLGQVGARSMASRRARRRRAEHAIPCQRLLCNTRRRALCLLAHRQGPHRRRSP